MNTNPKVSMKSNERHVGIDIGKATLDVHIYEIDLHWQTDNTAAGIKALVRTLKRYKLTRVLVEATGGYERAIVEAGLPIICSHSPVRKGRRYTGENR